MTRGVLLRMPMPGTPIEQSQFVIDHMYIAWRLWYIDVYKPGTNRSPNEDDKAFVRGVLGIPEPDKGK